MTDATPIFCYIPLPDRYRKPSHHVSCASDSETGRDMIIYRKENTKNYNLRRSVYVIVNRVLFPVLLSDLPKSGGTPSFHSGLKAT
jgi:hypothetical protein